MTWPRSNWQFGGYGQNNASNGAYQFGVGGDIPNLANGVLSFDAIYSYVKDSVATAVLGGSTDANGNPIPPFLPDVLTATISDNRAVMVLARYTNGPLKLYAGFEQIRYSAPSDPQMAFTNIAGDFVCLGFAIQWRIVEQLFREQQRRYYGGIALQVLKSRGRDRSVHLCFGQC